MEKKSKKIYLGLDIGTDSVGYAVTDDQYNLLRVHGDDVTKERLDTILMDTLEYQSKHGTTEGVRLSIDPVGLKEYLLARWGDESKAIGQGIDAFTAK